MFSQYTVVTPNNSHKNTQLPTFLHCAPYEWGDCLSIEAKPAFVFKTQGLSRFCANEINYRDKSRFNTLRYFRYLKWFVK